MRDFSESVITGTSGKDQILQKWSGGTDQRLSHLSPHFGRHVRLPPVDGATEVFAQFFFLFTEHFESVSLHGYRHGLKSPLFAVGPLEFERK